MSDDTPDRTELAGERTDMAEDRTALANERTFAGWARTAMAAIGIGLAFNALFGEMQPTWAAKAIATVFIVLGIFLIVMAERRACAINARLSSHSVQALKTMNVRIVALGIGLGAVALIAALWLLI
jgi:putative membrane protein